ncbi:hypothetical protein [Myxococcus sp. NMCA1]|uniref:hypothetical protein n=1 Tax=Myxococcus sp. NMCA1 TaxID=2996785 RepID=UPI0022862751|nr:hypothetical protein [Myxococcus sp. NMCA1]WAM24511.1 hypothetical protein OZ403_28815 [Myxococcus sp. NMCA1]
MRLPVPLLAATVLFALPARADITLFPEEETWLSVGPMYSVAFGADEPGTGVGGELTLNWFKDVGALGLFAQAQKMERGSARLCAGLQGTLFFGGVELGVMHETASRTRVATTGLHVAPYLALVFGSLGVRFGIPLAGEPDIGPGGVERTRHAREVGLVLTLKLPIALSRDSVWGPVFPWN